MKLYHNSLLDAEDIFVEKFLGGASSKSHPLYDLVEHYRRSREDFASVSQVSPSVFDGCSVTMERSAFLIERADIQSTLASPPSLLIGSGMSAVSLQHVSGSREPLRSRVSPSVAVATL